MTISEKVKKMIRRIYRITITTVLVIFGILFLIIVLIQTGPVQNYGRHKIEVYLENKLKTKVRIGHLNIGFPSRVIIRDIYLEDQRKDTLLFGGKIEVGVSMFRLLHKEVRVNNLDLENMTLKVKRQLPDSIFNYQFIIDAFASAPKKEPEKKDTSGGFRFVIGTIHLHQIRTVYQDDASGNDFNVTLGEFNTKLKTFDPQHQSYAIPAISLEDVTGKIRLYKPVLILKHIADTVSEHNRNAEPVHLELGDIDFSRIRLDYRDDAQNTDASIRLGNFHTTADSIDLSTFHIKLKTISLNNSDATMRLGKRALVKAPKVAPAKDTVTHSGLWSVDLNSFALDSLHLQYDDDNKKNQKKGIDYNHLQVRNMRIHATALHADPNTYRADISQISFDEQSGFSLKKLSATASYGQTGAELKNLIVKTSNSEIRNNTSIRYPSLSAMQKHPGDMITNLEFDKSKIAVKDILVFVPSLEGPLKDNQQAVLRLNGKLSGKLKDLKIPFLEIEGVGNTSLAASGEIKGLPDAKKAYYHIVISKLKTSRTDILRFVSKTSLPANIRIPENIALNGNFTGTFKRFLVNLHAKTSNGDADIHGTLDIERKAYDLLASTRSADLGYILKQDSVLGRVTLEATAKGSGFEPKQMNSIFHVKLTEAVYKSYVYRGLVLDANMHNGNGTITSGMQDPNLTYQLNATAGFLDKYPTVKLNLQLDTINMHALHLMSDSLQAHLMLDADFASTNPDQLQGQANLNDLGLTLGTLSIHTDSIRFAALHSDSGQSLQLKSEAADIDWTGKYKLTQVAESLKQFINKYYKIPVAAADSTEPEEWLLTARLKTSPLVLALMPSLKGTDSLTGSIQFNSRERGLALAFHSDKIQIGQQTIHQLNVVANTKDKSLDYRISVADAGKPGFQFYQTAVYGSLEDSKLKTSLLLKDRKNKDEYFISGKLAKENNGMRFVFNPDSILLNYQRWQIPADNFIHYDSSGLLVRNVKLEHGTESITLNSGGNSTSSPLDISFTDFKIKTLSQFASQDTLMAGGIINGKAEVKDLFTRPLFTADLKVDSLVLLKDSLGTLVIQVNNKELDTYIAHITLKGHENDVQIDGKYHAEQSTMDMDLLLNQLNLSSFKGMAFSQVRNMQGYLKGKLHASGNLTQPLLKGELHFENATIVPVITGEALKLSNDAISFDEDGFNFANFAMADSAGNQATLDGNVYTKDFRQYRFDLSFDAQNFRAVNAPKEPDRMFYGKLNLNANIDVTGDLDLPKVTAYLRANKNTDFYVILPSDDPEVVDRDGVVIFTSKVKRTDSTQLQHFLDSLASNARLKGLDVSATLETDSSAQFTLIIDERNGDALSIRGRAELTGGVDKSGKISLTGNYELVNGAYNLTLSVLHRRFDIQRGSVITWTGDPKKANIDITAIYTVNTAPIDLVQDQLSGSSADLSKYKARLPFQVKLNMTGELLKPVIKFDISLPENLLSLWPEVDTKLVQMRTDEAEENKQTFALLLLGRFIQQNPFQSAGAPTDAGTIAKQSASKLLSDQLNQLAGTLVKDVDINFDMNSDQDYSSGSAVNQTDLNIKVSKSLFQDRIRVTVGSDFQLEGTNPGQNATNLAGDVSVDYKLSKDGRYMVRVYRNDQYQTIVQGQVVETGLSFILTYDYNKFRELFQNRKEPPPAPKHKKHDTKPSASPVSTSTTSNNSPVQ